MAVVLTRRVGRSRVAGQIVRVIRAADRPEHYGKTGSLTTTATIFAECLEDYVKQYPYQFFNFYDLWSKDD